MKILVPVKAVHDPAQPIWWQANGPHWNETPLILNPFDAVALEAAAQWRQEGRVAEVVTVTIGPQGWEEVLRSTLALGADRAVRLAAEGASPLACAKELAVLVKRWGVDLVVMGKQGVEEDLAQTGPMLAGLLGWSQATFVSRLAWQDEQTLLVWREVDGGLEHLSLPIPAVITVDLRLNVPRYASLPNILKAKKKSLEVMEIGTMDTPGMVVQPVQPAPLRPARGVRLNSVAELAEVLKQWVKT